MVFIYVFSDIETRTYEIPLQTLSVLHQTRYKSEEICVPSHGVNLSTLF